MPRQSYEHITTEPDTIKRHLDLALAAMRRGQPVVVVNDHLRAARNLIAHVISENQAKST